MLEAGALPLQPLHQHFLLKIYLELQNLQMSPRLCFQSSGLSYFFQGQETLIQTGCCYALVLTYNPNTTSYHLPEYFWEAPRYLCLFTTRFLPSGTFWLLWSNQKLIPILNYCFLGRHFCNGLVFETPQYVFEKQEL
jgi:hypothetical protein